MRLEFFFDYGSPYSYLADTQLAGLCDRRGCELVYRPMLLGGVFNPEVREQDYPRQRGVAERKSAGPSHRAGHVRHTEMNNPINNIGRVFVRGRANGLNTTPLIDGDVYDHAARIQ